MFVLNCSERRPVAQIPYNNVWVLFVSDEGVARYNSNKTLAIYQLKIRATIFSKQTDFSTRFASRGTRQIIVYIIKSEIIFCFNILF